MRRNPIALLIVAVMTLMTASVGHAEPLRVAYNQWVGFTPFFVALEKDFFEAAGTSVEPVEFAGPGESLAPLMAGHLDVSLTTADNVVLLSSRAGSKPAILSVLDASYGGDALVAKTSIDSIAELEGKTVATTIGEVNHLLLLKALASAGVDPSTVNMVNMSPDEAGAAFVAGNLDAAVTWEPWVSKAASKNGHRLFTSKDVPNLLVDVMVVTQETRQAQNEALSAFMEGLAKGVAFLNDHPSKAHAIAGEWLSVSGDDVATMLEGVRIYQPSEVPALLAPEGGMHDSLSSIATFMKDQGNISSVPEIAPLLDPSLASDVIE
jgi:NitT/TauT family transport system substrate-binding protein